MSHFVFQLNRKRLSVCVRVNGWIWEKNGNKMTAVQYEANTYILNNNKNTLKPRKVSLASCGRSTRAAVITNMSGLTAFRALYITIG